MIELRDYQAKALRDIRRAFKAHRRVLLAIAQGAGKTESAAKLALDEVAKGLAVLFLVHRKELVEAFVRRLVKAGVDSNDIGVVMGGAAPKPKARIQVGCIDSIARRSARPPAGLVIIDEAHRAASKSYMRVVRAYPKARILGMTASPWRLDKKGLADAFDALVEGPPPTALISGKWIMSPRVFTRPSDLLPELHGLKRTGGDFNPKELEKRVTRSVLIGDIGDHYLKMARGMTALGFAVTIAHSMRIVETLRRRGIAAEHIDGKMSPSTQTAILARLRAGTTKVLFSCNLLAEGFDLPSVKCVILARPTRSLTLYLQQCGRCMRPHGRRRPIVLDHSGNWREHGLPDDDRDWSLTQTTGSAGAWNGRAPCKACAECNSVVPAGSRECPECGAEFAIEREPEEVAGELVEIARPTEADRQQVAAFATRYDLSERWADDFLATRARVRA